MLISLIAVCVLALLAGLAMPRVFIAAPAFWAHLVLAVGVMPLISAAMLHFTPVLTHGRAAEVWRARLPWLLQLAGLLALAVLGGALGYVWLGLAAGLALLGVLLLLAWMRQRARASLGSPHPGLAWYQAALACLALGLLAALAMPLWPAWHSELRAFHLAINLYGFVALTAVGTLQVLMPTVAGQADGGVAQRLRRDLKWALAGSLALALSGALELAPLAWLGLAGWGWVFARMAVAWVRLHRQRILAWHGAAPLLAAALVGLVAALLAHGLRDSAPLAIFLPGFLMPLVSGAAGHLAPIWLAPGRRAEHFAAGQQALNRWSGVRALLFLSAALLPLFGYRCAGIPALFALVWFGLLFMRWLWREEV